MARYKNFSIDELFTPIRGKGKYTRGYAEKNQGKYPVYSASLTAPLCYVDSFDYDGTFLTWTTNGYGGRIQIISGRFSINGDRGILIPRTKLFTDLEYIRRFLEPILIGQAVGRIVDGKKNEYTKVSPEVVAGSVITLPVTENGDIDVEPIEVTANRIKGLDALQKSLGKYREQFESVEVTIDSKCPTTTISLGDNRYFSLSIGERVLKKDSLENGVPVYSANVNLPFGWIEKSNISDFSHPSLLWGIDGNFSWNIIPAGHVFATTDHCGRLQIVHADLFPEYIYHYLQSTCLEYGFDRVFRANLENVKNIIEVKVPIDSSGKMCLKTQEEIANRYEKINLLKSQIIDKLKILSSVKIEVAI